MSAAHRRGRQPNSSPASCKRRRLQQFRDYRRKLVNLGSAYEEWTALKTQKEFQKDEELAQFLLHFYSDHSVEQCWQPVQPLEVPVDNCQLGISHADSNISVSSPVSGTQHPLCSTPANEFQPLWKTHEKECCPDSESDVPTPQLKTLDVSYHPHSSSYIKSDSEDTSVVPEDCDLSCTEKDIDMDNEGNVHMHFDEHQIHKMETSISYDHCLISLAKLAFSKCFSKTCTGKVNILTRKNGTALQIIAACSQGHKQSWWSQPMVKRIHAGNFMLCSNIILSGNNFAKIALLLKFMNMPVPAKSTFHAIQRLYVSPSVLEYWSHYQTEIFQSLQQPLVLLGDGRNDSPGHSAKYQTYTMMDNATKCIVDIEIVDVREVGGKSTNMELAAFQRCLQKMDQCGIPVAEVVTDAHTQIVSIMKKKYSGISHQLDLWHGSKAINKRLLKLAGQKCNRDLKPWIRDIINHFWFASSNCGQSEQRLTSIWRGVLHHVVNQHVWRIERPGDIDRCLHAPNCHDEQKPWLKTDSPAHRALRSVVYDKWITGKLSYFTKARSTSDLETFNNHILMYASKRFAYGYESYMTRNVLAAIDYNHHIDRQYLRKKNGDIVYTRHYSKRTKQWSALPVKERKSYHYVADIQGNILERRLMDTDRLMRSIGMPSGHPTRLSKTTAAVPPPPVQELVLMKKQRLQTIEQVQEN